MEMTPMMDVHKILVEHVEQSVGAVKVPHITLLVPVYVVAPGHYLEQNPILMQPYTSIIGSDLRTTIIETNEQKHKILFHVSKMAAYLAQMLFLLMAVVDCCL
jgi:hypothetical protein